MPGRARNKGQQIHLSGFTAAGGFVISGCLVIGRWGNSKALQILAEVSKVAEAPGSARETPQFLSRRCRWTGSVSEMADREVEAKQAGRT